MKREEAKAIVRSLVGRLIQDGTAFQLPGGRISEDEVTALKYFGDDSPAHTNSESFEDKEIQTQSIPINRNAFDAVGPLEEEIRLCLDFGTAMSKAWAGRREDEEPIPLMVGQMAGTTNHLVVPSSVYISQSGRIYFGASAETQHRQEIEKGRQCFDNLKQMLSEAEVGQELDDVPLSPYIDPTESGLSKGDLLVLYLAWLTDLALKSLETTVDSAVISGSLRYVRRRFAIPCFEHAQDETVQGDERAKWAKSVMERAILRAQIVADSLTDHWADLTVKIACPLLTECRNIDTKSCQHLLAENAPIREPVAAGASRFNEMIGEGDFGNEVIRRKLLVVDAGAGTTDFALFQVFQNKGDDAEIRYALISPSIRMCRIAGNDIDSIIRPLALSACNIDLQSRREEEVNFINISINSRIRDIKHDLFEREEAKIELRPNVSGILNISSVLQDENYKERGKTLCKVRDEIISSVFSGQFDALRQLTSDPYTIYVLLTGGSASLPIIRNLAEDEVEIQGVAFRYSEVKEFPNWIDRLPRDIANDIINCYPQCAVAIGGSAQKLAQEISDMEEMIVPAPPGPWILEKHK